MKIPPVLGGDTADVTVRVHHRCPGFATGSTLGPGADYAAWWASAEADGWAVILASPAGRPEPVIAAIEAAIGESPADRIRRLQDTSAEAIE